MRCTVAEVARPMARSLGPNGPGATIDRSLADDSGTPRILSVISTPFVVPALSRRVRPRPDPTTSTPSPAFAQYSQPWGATKSPGPISIRSGPLESLPAAASAASSVTAFEPPAATQDGFATQ